jgi:hypothetical protein
LEQYKEEIDKIWVFTVDDRTSEILIHFIKESVLLKRNDLCFLQYDSVMNVTVASQ